MLGMGGPIEELMSIGRDFKIPIIEDNCEAIGGKTSKIFMALLVISVYWVLIMGKWLLVEKEEWFWQIMKLIKDILCNIDHGHENNPNLPRGKDKRIMPGFNYRMTELQAAVGKFNFQNLILCGRK